MIVSFFDFHQVNKKSALLKGNYLQSLHCFHFINFSTSLMF
nr:MAG TPA: hypothetical protein [Bacteriophage sp.]